MSILKNGTILNRNQYRITQFIAQGGFGITYLAEEIGYYKQSGYGEEYIQSRNPETVVIKELYYNDYCQRDEQTGLISISNVDKKQEFQKLVKNQIDEGKTIRSLQHKNIIRTRDIFHENETAYMVMDYIESTDLEEVLKKHGVLPKEKALKYIHQILDAVDYIHTKIDKKILHLDISPSNILIDKSSDDAVLIDFGSALSYDNVAKNITSTTSQIVTGRKKHYSPNEQGDIDNLKSFDATFDTYAIGATLYHLLSGEKPPLSSMVSTGREKIIPPSEIRKDGEISSYLDAVIMKSIAPYYHDRYSSAEIFSKALFSENEFENELAAIKKSVAENNFSQANQQINAIKTRFLETPELQEMQKEMREKAEQERNEKDYALFIKKGDAMFASGDLDLAKDYYTTAKDIFPNRDAILAKLQDCEQKIQEKINQQKTAEEEAKRLQELQAASSFSKGETELLSTPVRESIPVADETELLSPIKETWEQPQQKPTIVEKQTVVQPQQEKNDFAKTPTSSEKKSKSNKGILIGAIGGLLLLGGILYASGIFDKSPKNPEPQNNVVTTKPVDSTAIVTNETTVVPENNVVIEEKKDPVVENVSATDETWKKKFETTFTSIFNAESSMKPESAIAKYKSLLNTLPSSASNEKSRVNGRIAALNKKIADAKKESNNKKETIIDTKPDKKISDADLAQYNKDVQWSRNMINAEGCDVCRENDVCKSQVTTRLKHALSLNPNGSEAKSLLSCLR